ncbi:MAG: LLM class flavin-dependent oxidoreductase, partial [Candidatus Dormibacteraceae bacterium]
MTRGRFRFGAVAAPALATDMGSEQWQATARRAEELGYSTLLMPDGTQLPATLPTLAVAATVTQRLRVGSFVLASPLHDPRVLAWEAHSLTQLTGGRFEMGIGTGHPDVVKRQSVELYGRSPLPGAERLARVGETIDRLRELDGDRRTPVLLTAAGPRAIAMAAEKADIVGIAAAATSSREEVRDKVDGLRSAAGARVDELELTMNLFVVGDE